MFKNLSCRITHQDYAALQDYADTKGMTVSEAMRDLIRSVGKRNSFEARLLSFVKKVEAEIGSGGAHPLPMEEVQTLRRDIAAILNRDKRNEWEDMNKLKRALYLLSTTTPHLASDMKRILEG